MKRGIRRENENIFGLNLFLFHLNIEINPYCIINGKNESRALYFEVGKQYGHMPLECIGIAPEAIF